MNTFGWDLVFAADIETINRSLSHSTSLLISTFDFDQQGFSIKGQFGTWQIAPGGSGKILILSISITSGQLMPPGSQPVNLSGLSVQLKVTLQLLPSPSTPGGQSLSFNFQQLGNGTDVGNGVVTPSGVIDSDKRLTPLQESALGMAVATCLVSNAANVSYVFATINPMVASGVPWLRPVASSYCYSTIIGTNTGVLSILSVTTQRDISQLELKVDPAILHGNRDVGLAIAPSLFLENVFRLGLADTWKTSPNSFALDLSGILCNTGTISLPSVSKSGETYYPQVGTASASIVADHVALSLNGSCDMHMGITLTFTASSNIAVGFDAGSKFLSMSVIGTPTFSKNVDVPWYDHLLDIFGPIAEVVLDVTTTVIGNELGDGISEIAASSQITGYAPKLVLWAGASGFTPEDAGLSNCFYLRGQIS